MKSGLVSSIVRNLAANIGTVLGFRSQETAGWAVEAASEPPAVRDRDKVCYLILHAGLMNSNLESKQESLLAAQREAEHDLGISIRRVYLSSAQASKSDSRYAFWFPEYRRDDNLATSVAESFLYAASIIHTIPIIDADILDVVFRIPVELLQDDVLYVPELVDFEEACPPGEGSVEFPSLAIWSSRQIPQEYLEAVWRIAPIVFRNEELRRAIQFLSTSRDKFIVLPGCVPDVIAEPEKCAEGMLEQSLFEDALQNAYKAVEAIIGDPPKDDRRFLAKIQAVGLDPAMEVGRLAKVPLHQMIRQMNRARDKKAAHGSTPDRRIRIAEMMEFQECAHLIVLTAIENELGHRVFPRRKTLDLEADW